MKKVDIFIKMSFATNKKLTLSINEKMSKSRQVGMYNTNTSANGAINQHVAATILKNENKTSVYSMTNTNMG